MSGNATSTNISRVKAPGPSLLASLITFNRIVNDPLQVFRELHNQYGDVACLNVGIQKIFVINNAQYVKYVLQENINNYKKLKRLEMQTKLLFGEGWTNKINRQIIRPFFEPQNYANMDLAIANSTEKMLARWRAYADNQQSFDVAKEMMSLSLTFTAKTLIGHDFQPESGDVVAIETIIEHFNSRAMSNFNLPESFPTPANRKYLTAVRRFKQQ